MCLEYKGYTWWEGRGTIAPAELQDTRLEKAGCANSENSDKCEIWLMKGKGIMQHPATRLPNCQLSDSPQCKYQQDPCRSQFLVSYSISPRTLLLGNLGSPEPKMVLVYKII